MKKLLIFTIIAAFTFLSACRKSDNPNIPELTRVPVPLITKDGSVDVNISKDDPSSFKGRIIVDLYFKDGPKPAKFDVVVIKNGDKTNVQHIKDGVTTFPTSVDITGAQLTSLFGSTIVLGDIFTIGVNVTTAAGQLFDAFPPGPNVVNYGSGLTGQPGASVQVDYAAVCPIDLNDFVGAATVVDNSFWQDTYPVTVTLSSPGVLKVTGINEQPNVSAFINIDVKYYSAVIPSGIIDPGSVASYVGPYTNLRMAGTGVVDACKLKINMNVGFSVDQGSFTPGPWILQK